MIVVRVELHSAITGDVTELARAHIINIGGTNTRGDYEMRVFRGRTEAALDRGTVQRVVPLSLEGIGFVKGHARLSLHVWHLIVKALKACGYGEQG